MKVRFLKTDQFGNVKGEVKDLESHIAKHMISLGSAEHIVESANDLVIKKDEVRTNLKTKKK
jgi:hypothetical protein